ncbi:uncharacterized protein [Apostichopus japonicus]|uniref:uncharacterized protein isoform X2 n=1 Tax=Stichopus japonicus TaxID=307972 RepID=UPI003AB79CAF
MMPRFRAFDFLDEVQRHRQVFLSCYLVAIPFHLETLDQYAHNGVFTNNAFRKPWLYPPDDKDGFSPSYGDSLYESENDDMSYLSCGVKLEVETFKQEDEIVYIPSSNPSSPAVTSQECLDLQQAHVSVSSDAGVDDAEDEETMEIQAALSKATSQVLGTEFFLELPEPTTSTFNDVPTRQIVQLCLHLKKKQVQDPFVNSAGKPNCSSCFFRKDSVFSLGSEETVKGGEVDHNTDEITLTEKDFIPKKINDRYFLEATGEEFTPERFNDLTEAILKDSSIEVFKENTEFDIQEEFDLFKKYGGKEVIKTGCEDFLSLDDESEHEHFTWIRAGAPKEFPMTYLQEVPPAITIGSTPPPPLPSPFNDHTEDYKLFDVSWEGGRNVISPATISNISLCQWKDEKYFGAVSGLIVKEPTVESAVITAPETTAQLREELLSDLKVTTEDIPSSTAPDCDTSLGSINLLTDQGKKSVRKTLEQNQQFLTNKIISSKIYWGDDDVTQIDWGDADPPLEKLSLNDLCDAKVKTEQINSGKHTNKTAEKFQSLSSKIAGMLQKSSDIRKWSTNIPTEIKTTNKIEQPGIQSEAQHPLGMLGRKDVNKKESGTSLTKGLIGNEATEGEKLQEHHCERKPEKRRSYFGDPLNDFLFLSGVPGYRGHIKEEKIVKKKHQEPKEDGIYLKIDVDNCQKPNPPKEAKTEKDSSTMDEYIHGTLPDPEISQDAKLTPEINLSSEEVTQPSKKKKRSKTKLITVKIPAGYQAVVDVIEQYGHPILKQLQIDGHVPSSYTFRCLKPDVVRSLIKQECEGPREAVKREASKIKLQSLTQLYICLSTSEAALQCDLTTAVTGLTAMLHKYHSIIQGSLDDLRHNLVQAEIRAEENSVRHPKIAELAKQISDWLKRKMLKADEDLDLKILVILKKNAPCLANSIITELNSFEGLRALSLEPTVPASPIITTKALDSHNCVIVVSTQIDQDFMWAQFSLVVEYAFEEGLSIWQNLCIRQNIRHLGLKIEHRPTTQPKVEETEKSDLLQSQAADPKVSLKVLCSSKITEDSELLCLLESKYDITILERNFVNLKGHGVQADITIDVLTGVMNITHQDVLRIEALTRNINSLSQQYQKLWILVRNNEGDDRCFQSKVFRRCLCQLYSAIAQYSKKEDQFEVKVIFGCSVEETAELIHSVCQNAEKNISSAWHKEDWLHRQCITAYPSKHEIFLTQFPSINSFTAQVLLTSTPLNKLLSSSAEELGSLAPWVPRKFLKIFEEQSRRSFDVDGCLAKTAMVKSTSSQSKLQAREGIAARQKMDICQPLSGLCQKSGNHGDRNKLDDVFGSLAATTQHRWLQSGHEGDVKPPPVKGEVQPYPGVHAQPDHSGDTWHGYDTGEMEVGGLGINKRKYNISPEMINKLQHLHRIPDGNQRGKVDNMSANYSRGGWTDPLQPPRDSSTYKDSGSWTNPLQLPRDSLTYKESGSWRNPLQLPRGSLTYKDEEAVQPTYGMVPDSYQKTAIGCKSYMPAGETRDVPHVVPSVVGDYSRYPIPGQIHHQFPGAQNSQHAIFDVSQAGSNTTMESSKHRRLAYQKVPGAIDGQTKLRFL